MTRQHTARRPEAVLLEELRRPARGRLRRQSIRRRASRRIRRRSWPTALCHRPSCCRRTARRPTCRSWCLRKGRRRGHDEGGQAQRYEERFHVGAPFWGGAEAPPLHLLLLPACGEATNGNTASAVLSFAATPSPRLTLMPPLNDGVRGVAPATLAARCRPRRLPAGGRSGSRRCRRRGRQGDSDCRSAGWRCSGAASRRPDVGRLVQPGMPVRKIVTRSFRGAGGDSTPKSAVRSWALPDRARTPARRRPVGSSVEDVLGAEGDDDLVDQRLAEARDLDLVAVVLLLPLAARGDRRPARGRPDADDGGRIAAAFGRRPLA